MPVFRNVNPNRRLGNQTPVIYGGEGSSSSSSFTAPPFDRSYSHSRQQERRPCVPSQSSTINTSRLPSPRESSSRSREPGHIPRPRNAFIIFRSSYINGRASAGEGQQNELSKQAGKVWNRMTEDEKKPFVAEADAEKKWHQEMYPNYTYCPGRGAARRKGKTIPKNTKNTSGPKRKMSATSSSVSSESTFPEIPFATPAQRSPRAAVIYTDITSQLQEPEPQFDLTMRPPHLDLIPEQFGFKYHCDSTAMLAYLPPMSNINEDTLYAGDVPSLFSQFSCLPADPPTVRMTDDDPHIFSSDGSITEVWPQPTVQYAETPRKHVPGFAWSYPDDFFHTPMLSEDMCQSEKDMTFMGSIFNFEGGS